MSNVGKTFEQQFKNSIPKGCYYLRLHDSALGFDIKNSTQRFSLQSPFDCVLYYNSTMYTLELKSTKGTSFSFDGASQMIKKHQIKELRLSKTYDIISGFILNFRTTNHTYFLDIKDFDELISNLNKKSFNEKDIKDIAFLIEQKQLKVNNRFNLLPFLERYSNTV